MNSNNIYRFTLTAKQHILVLSTFLIFQVMAIIGLLFFIGFVRLARYPEILVVYSLFFVLPTILLHAQYYYKNRDVSLTIDTDSKTFGYTYKNSEKVYLFDEIVDLRYYATMGHISKKGRWETYPFDAYRFYKITFNDGYTLYITCLLINDIEHTLETILKKNAEWKFRALPFLY